MGGAIPISEIVTYAKVFGFANLREFVKLVMLIDRIFMKASDKKQPEEPEGGRENS